MGLENTTGENEDLEGWTLLWLRLFYGCILIGYIQLTKQVQCFIQTYTYKWKMYHINHKEPIWPGMCVVYILAVQSQLKVYSGLYNKPKYS